MRKIALYVLFFVAIAFTGFGQYNTPQNGVWVFGHNAGLDFSSGTPVGISTSVYTIEGSASISDARNRLLFYTDGYNVWDSTNTMMPASTSGLGGFVTASTTQAGLIVPYIEDSTKYYVFSLENGYMSGSHGKLAVSTVDMTLRSGLGDVVSSTMGRLIRQGLSEKMTVVAGNNCDYWVITHHNDSPIFYSYRITAAGISDSPVVSVAGSHVDSNGYLIGTIKVSPDRTKLLCNVEYNGYNCEVYDFNPNTGVVSGAKILEAYGSFYSGEFSPDNSKLYLSDYVLSQLYQYDLTAGSWADVRASKYTVSYSFVYDMKLAKDNRLYLTTPGGTMLHTIDSPNLAGARCTFVDSSVSISSGTICGLSFPNLVYTVVGVDTIYRIHDTTLSLAIGDSITLNAGSTGNNYYWNNGSSTNSIRIGASGTYWCVIVSGCNVWVDTFHVDLHLGVIDLNDKSAINVPNAFTPESTTNRIFKILYNGEVKLNYFRVFDRWGNKVFESTDINACWDGHYNGKLMPQDAYIYQIQAVTCSGKVVSKTGNVTLLR